MEMENGATFRRMQIRVQLSHASTGASAGRERRQPGQGKCFNCHGYGHWYVYFNLQKFCLKHFFYLIIFSQGKRL